MSTEIPFQQNFHTNIKLIFFFCCNKNQKHVKKPSWVFGNISWEFLMNIIFFKKFTIYRWTRNVCTWEKLYNLLFAAAKGKASKANQSISSSFWTVRTSVFHDPVHFYVVGFEHWIHEETREAVTTTAPKTMGVLFQNKSSILSGTYLRHICDP